MESIRDMFMESIFDMGTANFFAWRPKAACRKSTQFEPFDSDDAPLEAVRPETTQLQRFRSLGRLQHGNNSLPRRAHIL